ncbi:MAG TPA: hypothetical protein G4O00_06205 [Thermoflexia bacterium]|jgi:hypothetical protein|nr:hypothetical protein [Thermoflexia bacterium]
MNLRTKVLLFGGVLGALIGVGVAYLYLQSTPIQVDEEGRERLPPVQPGDALKVTLGLLTAIRQIVGLGRPPG